MSLVRFPVAPPKQKPLASASGFCFGGATWRLYPLGQAPDPPLRACCSTGPPCPRSASACWRFSTPVVKPSDTASARPLMRSFFCLSKRPGNLSRHGPSPRGLWPGCRSSLIYPAIRFRSRNIRTVWSPDSGGTKTLKQHLR